MKFFNVNLNFANTNFERIFLGLKHFKAQIKKKRVNEQIKERLNETTLNKTTFK